MGRVVRLDNDTILDVNEVLHIEGHMGTEATWRVHPHNMDKPPVNIQLSDLVQRRLRVEEMSRSIQRILKGGKVVNVINNRVEKPGGLSIQTASTPNRIK